MFGNKTIAPSNFDVVYLNMISKAAKASGASREGAFGIQQYGDDGALFTITGADICGVVMPLNSKGGSFFDVEVFAKVSR